MVELYSDHPARLSDGLRMKLARLSFGNIGYMREYILDKHRDIWKFNDKVYWLERDGVPFAWCVRAQDFPYCDPSFMVYIRKNERRKKWGTFLYREATKYSKREYEVYGTHSQAAKNFYTKLGRKNYT
jgi:GNAT superfamily N-acetyltransferase